MSLVREKFDLWIKRIGQNRGAPRLWFDTPRIEAAGLLPGVRFNIKAQGEGLALVLDENGNHGVSSRTRNGKTVPVVDINNKEDLESIAMHTVVRIIIRKDGIWVLPLASEVAKRERLNRLLGKLQRGEPLATASLSHGGGIAAHAAHKGLADAGLKSQMAFANEIDETYGLQSVLHNDATQGASMLIGPIQELVQDEWVMRNLPKCELVELGIPCSSSSSAGRSKNKNAVAEAHPEVGHMVYSVLSVIGRVQPALVVIECVENYASTGSASILRLQLRDMGYKTTEVVLSAQQFGCIENRIRWFFIAHTAGLECDTTALLASKPMKVPVLADLLDPIALDAKCWSEMSYLKTKETRDVAAGKGFKMQVVNGASNKVPTVRKMYSKSGSTDPLVQHEVNPDLLRKFSAAEHGRVKNVPAHLFAGVSETTAHQLLGQSVAYDVVRALYRDCVGQALIRLRDFGANLSGACATGDRIAAVAG